MLVKKNKEPLVSIGIPVYNEGKFLSKALDSLLNQDYDNFELIISDNASEDDTQEMCLDYATKDKRIFYHRFEKNKGASANFKQVLDLAKGKYFMWAGGHDLWESDVISRCVDTLENDSEIILAYPRAKRIDPQGNLIGLAANQIDTRGMSPPDRFSHLIWKISGGDLIYGVIRTQALKQIRFKTIWGGDQAVLAELSLQGTFAHIPETFFYWRRVRDESLEFRKKTVPLMIDPVNGYKKVRKELPELWRELGDEYLAIIERASLPYNDKMILRSETKRCFAERYGVRWPVSILKSDSKDGKTKVTRNILLATSAAPLQSPFSTTEKRPPIGLGFLISVLRNAGHKVFFIDNYLRPSNFLETGYLQKNKIDHVGIYANTICYRDTLRMLYKLEYLRRIGKWKGKIIVGGPHTTVALDTIPDFVDYVVQGEGEKAILDIVDGKVTKRVVKYPRIKNLDELPMPAWDFFINLPYNWSVEWFQKKPVFTMNTSRGCPFRCKFCSVGSIWGKEYAYFSADRIVSEIEYLIEHHGAKGIYFREDNFTLNKKRLKTFCNLLLKKGINIAWACETRVDTLDKETVELMSRAGACGFYLGVESGSQRILDFLNKDITVDQTRDAFKLCQEFGIKTAASLVVGVPTETEKDLTATHELLKEIKPTITWYNVFVGIPDSELYQYVIDNKLYEFIDDRGLVYLKGHNERVRKFYGRGWDADIPVSLHENEPANPKISVVMAVYNGEKYLKEAIESVLRQTYQDFEFIIVDDASNDKTSVILESFDDPRIKFIKNPENLGLTKSLNKGIKAAKGKYIARMDADDISLPHRFERQVEFLERNPDHAVVGSSYYQIHDSGKICSLIHVLTDDLEIREGLRKQNWFGHGSVMIWKDAFLKVGGYDEKYKFAQDYDLWLRMAEVYRLANTEEPLYCWRLTPSCISKDKEAEQRYYANLAISEAAKRQTAKTDKEKMCVSLTDPVVSVIVPTYNRPDMLKDAINSILAQSYQDFEIVVVNDCGQDVEATISEMNKGANKIVYIKHSCNKGLAAARNTGIKLARGKYIAYLDDDDIFYPDHLETLVNSLEQNHYHVAYTDAYRAHQVYQDGSYKIIGRDIPYSFDFSKDILLIQNISPVNCFMNTKQCLEEVGLFDDNFHAHEDWELWIRLSRKYDFMHIKKVTTEFRWREDGSTMSSSQRHEFLRTMEEIFKRYHSEAQGKAEVLQQQKNTLMRLRRKVAGQEREKKCSIIIPIFNQVEFTKKCLEAVIENTPDELYEVVIVDNASTDGTKELLGSLAGDIKIITNKENLGFAKACNQGARAASSEYLLFLNNDTEVQPGWLEPLVRVLDADLNVAAVGSKMLFHDRTIQHAGVALFDNQKLPDPLMARHIYSGESEFCIEANTPKEYQALTAACLLIRKNIYEKAGGFDEGYWNGYEDIDLCFKIQQMGKKLVYQPQSIVIHHESKSGSERFSKVNQNIELLHSKWLGKIKPDFVITPVGKIHSTDANKIGPYKLINSKETLFKNARELVSIIILTYNQLEYTKKCIESIFEHTKEPFELIVVDNGSTDGTVEYLETEVRGRRSPRLNTLKGPGSTGQGSRRSKIEDRESEVRVKIIKNKENLGFALGNNKGIAEAKGDYVVLMNNDVVVTPRCQTTYPVLN